MGKIKHKKVSQKRYERLEQKAKKNPTKFESKMGEGILKNSKKLFTLKTPEYTEAIKGVMKEVGFQANQRFNAGKNFKELMKATTPSLSVKGKKSQKKVQENPEKYKDVLQNLPPDPNERK